MPWILLVVQLLPTLFKTIQELTRDAEDGCPTEGCGPAKRAAVVQLVQAGINASDRLAKDGELLTTEQKEAVCGMVGEAVDVVVEMQNAVGTFKHGKVAEVADA